MVIKLNKILKNNSLVNILLITVAILAPLMYSLFFIQSVWDPYGGAKHLPIAVVNKDIPAKYQGKVLNVGQQTVNQLKKNHELKWEFVSPQEAKSGMSHHRYYTVVTIPQDFSKDASTVMSKHPRKMELHYQTNDSKNFLARSISDVGMSSLNSQIRASVTKAYATAMFDQLHTLGKGMNQAASGAHQISDGTMTLADGANQYFAGVSKVNHGVQQLQMGVAPLGAGATQLVNGSAKLAAGVNQFTGGTNALAAGLQLLTAKIPELNGGIGQLQDGLNSYTNGTKQLSTGLQQISNQSGQLRNGSHQLNMATGQFAALNNGSQQISNNVANFNNVLQSSHLMETLGSAQQLGTAAASLQNQLGQVNQMMDSLKGLDASQLAAVGNAVNSIGPSLTSGLTKIGGNAENSATTAARLAQTVAGDANASAATKAAANSAAQSIAGNANDTKSQIGNLQNVMKGIEGAQSSLAPTMQKLQSLQQGMPQLSATLTNAQQLLTQTNALMDQLNRNQALIAAMPGQMQQLTNATQQLSNGTAQLAQSSGMINTFANGVDQYTSAVDQANHGAQKLSLASGQLTSGGQQLKAGWSQYASGVQKAGDGAALLVANSPALNSGAAQLATGLGQLGSKVPALISGVNQLANGTSQLDANSPKLASGIARLNAGAGTLASRLSDGADQVNSVHTNNKTAGMFGAPTKLTHSSYSKVPNYGHALAPFIMATGLFIGVLIFTLEFPSNKILAKTFTKQQMLAHEFKMALLISILMAAVQNVVLMMMGLHVHDIQGLFTITIIYTIAQMAIMQFLTMALGRFGTILGLLLFVAQLGGAGGMFPMEVTNKFFNMIHPILPMTYGINGLRQVITGGFDASYLRINLLILVGYAVVFYILLLLIAGHGLFNEEWNEIKTSMREKSNLSTQKD